MINRELRQKLLRGWNLGVRTRLQSRSGKRAMLIFAVLGAAAVTAGGLMFFYPLELMELRTRIQLRAAGIEEVTLSGSLHAYVKDECSAGDPKSVKPAGAGCNCIAMVHGLGDNALTWRKILEKSKEDWGQIGLSGETRWVAIDLPGTGKTPAPQELSQYRVRDQAHALIAALKPVCSSWVVVGNSLGGWIAAWMALEWEGVSRLVLLSPAGLNVGARPSEDLTQPTVASLKEFQRKAYFRPRPIPERVWEEITRNAKHGNAKAVMAAQVPEDDLNLKLASIRVPKLILWGMADQVLPLHIGHQMRDLAHSVVWREVAQCGHLPQKECPQPVMQAIVDMVNFGMM